MSFLLPLKALVWFQAYFKAEVRPKIALQFQDQGKKWLSNFKNLTRSWEMYIFLSFTVLLKFTILFVFEG